MVVKSHRKTNADLSEEEQNSLRTLTAPYGRMAYASEKTGISDTTIRNILHRGYGKREYVDILRSFIAEESKVAAAETTSNSR